MFFHTFPLFQSLLSYSSIFTKMLLTNFFCTFLGCTGIQVHVLFSHTFGTPSQYIVHAPPYFWHRTRGFFEARRFWEPGSRLTTSDLSPFCLLLKVSGANVHQANANHTFLTHKNPRTDIFSRDISPAMLRSTARVRNPQEISKLVNKVDCYLSYDSVLVLCSRRQCGPSSLRNPSQWVLNVPLPYGMHLKVSPEGCHIFEQLSSPMAQKRRGCDMQQSGLIIQCPFLAFFRVL